MSRYFCLTNISMPICQSEIGPRGNPASMAQAKTLYSQPQVNSAVGSTDTESSAGHSAHSDER